MGEVPVGALIVSPSGEVLGEGYNSVVSHTSALAHAEVVALQRATLRQGVSRLDGCTLYCTLEPCLMCLGAAANHHIARVVYLCDSPKYGALSQVKVGEGGVFAAPHKVTVSRHGPECGPAGGCTHLGDLRSQSSQLLQEFFAGKRGGAVVAPNVMR